MKERKTLSKYRAGNSGINNRDRTLGRHLNRIGKVGGIKDSRFGAKDNKKTEAQKSLQRHIVEKIRQLGDVELIHEDSDPLIKAAFGEQSEAEFARRNSLRRIDEQSHGGIQSDVVEEEFFGTGSDASKFKDNLAEKIAATKLERLKRVEENEEQRSRLKAADVEWSKEMRFMLAGLKTTKPKKPQTDEDIKKKRNVLELFDEMSTEKRIPPSDAKPPINAEEKQLKNLETVLENADQTEAVVDEKPSVITPESKKNEIYLLRLLFRMPDKMNDNVLIYVSRQFERCRLHNLKSIIKTLALIQLFLERCQSAVYLEQNNLKLTSTSNATGCGAFSPELVHVLTRMWENAVDETSRGLKRGPLVLRKRCTSSAESDTLDLSWADSSARLPHDQLTRIRLTCLRRLVLFSKQTFDLYTHLLPSCVCAQLFNPLRRVLEQVIAQGKRKTGLPIDEVKKLCDLICQARNAPTPDRLTSNPRLTVLGGTESDNVKSLKQLGLLPQLEPRFNDKYLARSTHDVGTKRVLQRQLAKEKRGTMREMRRDSQYLATHQLESTKSSDAIRIKKTQAIMNNLRSIDD